MFKPIVLTCVVVLLAASAWAGEFPPFTTTVPEAPKDFQNPYKYTPPPAQFRTQPALVRECQG